MFRITVQRKKTVAYTHRFRGPQHIGRRFHALVWVRSGSAHATPCEAAIAQQQTSGCDSQEQVWR